MAKGNVSKATSQRYPVYLKALRKLKSQGVSRIMSQDFSKIVGIEPTTIRRDFSFLGTLGRQGYGYDVDILIDIFNNELGMIEDEQMILIGVGNLGRALLKYNGWDYVVGSIACGFDVSVDRLGVRFDVPVYHLDELEEKIPKNCRIAIIACSSKVQETVDRLLKCGIIGIVDFTHQHIEVPKGIILKSVDVVSTIQELIFEAREMNR